MSQIQALHTPRVATPSIPEDGELETDASETTSLLKEHHAKFDKKYTEDGFHLDAVDDEGKPNGHATVNFEEAHMQNDIPPEVRGRRSLSQLSLLDEQMDQYHETETKTKKLCGNIKVSPKEKKMLRNLKISIIFLFYMVMVFLFSLNEEVEKEEDIIAISSEMPYFSNLTLVSKYRLPLVKVYIHGPLNKEPEVPALYWLNYTIGYLDDNHDFVPVQSMDGGPKSLGLADEESEYYNTGTWHKFDETIRLPTENTYAHEYAILMETNVPLTFTLGFAYQPQPKSASSEVVIGFVILFLVYVLIGFELVHRTLAAMLGAFAVIGVEAAFKERPTLEGVMQWIDYQTLALLWGMMTIVAIFSETGFFEWCALQSYKLAKGQVWTLITLLCFFSGIVSAFLDNVTTILLLTPVTISLCEVLNLDPRLVLIAEVLFSNIGGTATAIGDPPNVIIISNSEIKAAGIEFANFTLHMSVGIVFCMIAGYFLLRLLYRKKNLTQMEPPEIRELKQEIEVWRRAAAQIMVVSREESTVKALLMQKVYQQENELQNKLYDQTHVEGAGEDWRDNLEEMKAKYKITNMVLLIKCGAVLIVTITMFFIQSFISGLYLDIGWIAVIAAMALLVLSDIHDLESVMHRVEWTTLLFFAALFILMEGLTELGVIDFIGDIVADLIKKVDEESRLTVAIVLILWVSALASSFIDNIPFTTAMVPVIISLSEDSELNLPLEPMVWSLAFGACLGGNGTLIGASANVVCAGIAQQHGYPFSFVEFTLIGFPMMLGTTFVAMIYLLICHSWGHWGH